MCYHKTIKDKETRSRSLLLRLLIPLLILFFSMPAAARTATDQLGRTVKIPERIQRIIPLGGATRFVVYLQAFDLVAGVEAIESRKPPTAGRPYNVAIRSAASRLPVVGEGLQKPLNLEAIISLRPDLIITSEGDREQADRLSRTSGIPVVVIDYGGMGVLKLDKAKQAIKFLGDILGREKRASELAGYIDLTQKELSGRIPVASREKIYAGAVTHRGIHGITSTDADYFPLVLARATNIAANSGRKGHLFIDREQLLAWNPSLMLIDAAGLGLVRDDYTKQQGFYSRLAAIKNNRVYVTMPYNNYHTNIEIALSNSWYVAKVLYPENFKDISPQRKTDEICRAFTGIPCYGQLEKEFGGFGRLFFTDMKIHAH